MRPVRSAVASDPAADRAAPVRARVRRARLRQLPRVGFGSPGRVNLTCANAGFSGFVPEFRSSLFLRVPFSGRWCSHGEQAQPVREHEGTATMPDHLWMIEFDDRSDGGPHRVGPFSHYAEAQTYLRSLAIAEWSGSVVGLAVPVHDVSSVLTDIACRNCTGVGDACSHCGGSGRLVVYRAIDQLPR